MTGGALYYIYVCAVARILSCSAAGLQDGQHFLSTLLERFKDGSKSPSHFTPGNIYIHILFPVGRDVW